MIFGNNLDEFRDFYLFFNHGTSVGQRSHHFPANEHPHWYHGKNPKIHLNDF